MMLYQNQAIAFAFSHIRYCLVYFPIAFLLQTLNQLTLQAANSSCLQGSRVILSADYGNNDRGL